MWEKTAALLCVLLQAAAAVASPCWQGATLSEAVVSPAVRSSGILRVPGMASLAQCVAACCDLPGCDLAWLFEGRCYVLSCRQRQNCRPTERPGADSYLAFLRRGPAQTLVLQSLVRGEPYGGRWRLPALPSEAPGDVEALKDLALLDGAGRDFYEPGALDLEYPEGGSPEEREGGGAGGGLEAELFPDWPHLEGRDGLNQSESEDGPTRQAGPAESGASSGPNLSRGAARPTGAPTEVQTGSVSTPLTLSPQKPSAAPDSTHQTQTRTSFPTTAPPPLPSPTPPTAPPTQPVQPLTASLGDPVEPALPTDTAEQEASVPPAPPTVVAVSSLQPPRPSQPSSVGVVTPPPRRDVLNSSRRGLSCRWEQLSGPPVSLQDSADLLALNLSHLDTGQYTFRLTVSAAGSSQASSLTAPPTPAVVTSDPTTIPPPPTTPPPPAPPTTAKSAGRPAPPPPPVAHASGSHSLTLPNNSLVLRGSVTDGDQSDVHFLWVRDSQSPAAGDVLYGSDSQASLYLANLVEGTYLFQLRVTDAQGRSSVATATVEVRPEPGGGDEVELELLVSLSQVSLAQRDTLLRQLAALLHVMDSDIQLRALQGHSQLSTVLRFSVRGPDGTLSGSRLVSVLRSQLLRDKTDYLLFRALRVDTALCLLRCSGRGQCDPITKECVCDPFWTENLIRRYLGDGESNCEWRLLYVVLSSFSLIVCILSLGWTLICCCKRRRRTKVRKKTKYTILDNMDEQERVELRPKYSIKHRSTEHNSSLMMSESELDSDQDTIFSRDRPVHSRSRANAQAARNGNAFG
ncbi:dyslexia-associated protein KIAA0319 [Myripristis murdjan]|uniref:dyslexia-associated protein KIAA0319 n=1 Tax=Myripristis murdjan TaxID=586833 RepID=UPI001175EE12|nr:dyslexia-associated protein KIAA0319-like [Myripristis murdjan]